MSPNNRERRIQKAIMDHPEQLGYPEALAVREFYFGHSSNDKKGEGGGQPDVVLLPSAGAHRLVIIEAKYVKETDGKVVGQLRKYHEEAQDRLRSGGLELLRNFARDDPEKARDKETTRMQAICGGIHRDEAQEKMKTGSKLKPEEIGLFVAIEGGPPPDSVERELVKACEDHGLNMGVVILEEGLPRVIRKIVVANRITETDRSTTP